MAKKTKKLGVINLKPLVLKGPKYLVQGISSSIEGIQTTKVIQTYIMENNKLKIMIAKDGRVIFSGIVKWIGNKEDNSQGTVMCISSSDKGGKDLRLIVPSEDTVQDIGLDLEKSLIKINSKESVKCSVCGKGIQIFDEILGCPLCGSKAHSDHLSEWIKMRHSCPICKKNLELDNMGMIVPKQ